MRLFAISLAVMLGILSPAASAQSNEWAWMGGSTTVQTFSVYGTLGTPALGNAPGGRSQAATWTDLKGNLWLFGGFGLDSAGNPEYLNDLWEFNPTTGLWTWMSGGGSPNSQGVQPGVYGILGTPAASNMPNGRSGAVSWIDPKGNLWLFGGYSLSYTGIGNTFNDLWEYSPSTNQWAWMSGANIANQNGVYGTLGTAATGNVPGARQEAVSLVDGQGNFWLFGGAGYDATSAQGPLNDLWKFNPTTSQWTWVSGANMVNAVAVPGTQKKAAVGNVPGARSGAVGWVDASSDIWIFGGGADLNDLWVFSPTSNEWAWMGGVTTIAPGGNGPAGIYGIFQTEAAASWPGGRFEPVSWIDSKGNLWMFGGEGYDSTDTQGFLNDLWEFNPSLGQWAWMGGDATIPPYDCAILANYCGQYGVVGTSQVPALGNMPGGRYEGASWVDNKGNFWIFGGNGYDAVIDAGSLSDLWEFQPNTGSSAVTATPTISPGSGTYTTWQTVTLSDTTPNATIYYSIDDKTPDLKYSGPITVSSSETIEAIATASGLANSNIATAAYVAKMPQVATPTLSLASGTYGTAQTVTISDITPGATIYYAIGSAPTASSALYSGPIAVSAPETVEAIAVAYGYLDSPIATAAYNIGLNPPAAWTWMGGSSTVPASCAGKGICSQPGWYGTFQTPAAANIPGARNASVTWTDNNGNLWLFGGSVPTTPVNDLWEYKPSTGLWTWMAGSGTMTSSHPGIYGTLGTAAAGNTPGSRLYSVGWTDSQGNLWLFGGYGLDANGKTGPLNDLWKFAPSTNLWTWMGGGNTLVCSSPTICTGHSGVYGTLGTPAPANIPGGRSGATVWTDHSGNVWLYGGHGIDDRGTIFYSNDLWKFNLATQEWTWMGGRQFAMAVDAGYNGVYDTVGAPALMNNPGSLIYTANWTDNNGKLWVFGGYQVDVFANQNPVNDMWEFDPSISEWTFTSPNSLGGGGTGNSTYGTLGSWATANIPGERRLASSWTDSGGNFWMFGGLLGQLTVLNELWEFKPGLNEWAWMGGSNSVVCLIPTSSICDGYGQPGSYGTLGTPQSTNVPSGRESAATWTDSRGNLWLFGGNGFDAAGTAGGLNDLWQYSVTGTATTVPVFQPAAAPAFSVATGTYASFQTVTLSDATAGATIYYTTDGTTPTSSSPVYATPLSVKSSETVQAIAVASNFSASSLSLAVYTISLPQAATPTFSVPAGVYQSAQTVTITDATAGATIYYTTNGTAPTTASTVYSGAITVSFIETLEAIAVASGYNNSAVATAAYNITPPPTFTVNSTPASLTVSPGGQGTVSVFVTPQNGFSSTVSLACSGLPTGVTCSFSPASFVVLGNAATSLLTISASAQAELSQPAASPDHRGVVVLALTFFLIGWKRRRLQHKIFLAVAIISLGLSSGCGGGGGNTGGSSGGAGVGPVTSIVTITASSSTIQQSTQLSLTVQ